MAKHVFITNKGYWGIGKTPQIAAKEASIGTKASKTLAFYYEYPERMCKEVNVTNMGSVTFTWTDWVMERYPTDDQRTTLSILFKRGQYEVAIVAKKLVMTPVEED